MKFKTATKMNEKKFNGKAIYQPSGKAAEYSKWACNFYVGCSNGCAYCYCKKGILAGQLGGNKPTLKKCFRNEQHALEVFEKELKVNLPELQKHGLFFSFTTDPMLDETIQLTINAVSVALMDNIPCKILTKCVDFSLPNTSSLLDKIGFPYLIKDVYKKNLAIGFTLTGHNELEPNAPSNSKRIEKMKEIHDSGIKTFASIEPIIDFESSKRMIIESYKYCDLFKIGLMSGREYDKKEVIEFVDWLDDFMSQQMIHVSMLYMKESLQKLTGITNKALLWPFVGSDFNLFEN